MTGTGTTPSPPLEVTGGSHGLAATYAQVRALATVFDTSVNRMRDWCRLGANAMTNPDLVESSVLSPLTFLEAESACIAATTGPQGLSVASLGWEADAVLIRATVTAFEDTDRLVDAALEAIDTSLGRLSGTLLAWVVDAGVVTAPLWLPPLLVHGGALTDHVLADDALTELQDWVVTHPDLVQHAFNGSGGLLEGFVTGLLPGVPPGVLPIAPTAEGAAGILAGLYPPDGDPQVGVRDDLATPSGPAPLPGSLADVLQHLDQVNGWSAGPASPDNGTIEIQTWVGPDGVPHHIVYLPGTDDLTTTPWSHDGDVRDLHTDLAVIGGGETAYGNGIVQAMHDAGISPEDPVMIVGHSQGGMEAVWTAGHSGFHVSQVVTAGAPVGAMGDAPAGTSVLSLENSGDVVPLLDGENNADTASHVTVTFVDGGDGVGGHHDLSHYVHGAAGVDASADPSLTDHLAGMHGQGFLTGGSAEVTYQAFQITRA